MLPILVGGSQLFIEKQCEFSVSVSSLQTIGFSRNFLAVPCSASGNIVRSLSWKSLDILQLSWRVLCTIQKNGKHIRLNSTGYELSTNPPLKPVLWIFTIFINLNKNFADLTVYSAICPSTKAIPGINLVKSKMLKDKAVSQLLVWDQ